jgi:soluble lytic murein transglycosylase-like protein
MAHEQAWRTLAEMELHFKRSSRRAATRREREARPSRARPYAVRVILVAAALFAALGELSSLSSPAGSASVLRAHANAGDCPISVPYRAAFATAARETHLPYPLVVAVAFQESKFDPAARSHAGAQGLLQVMPATARELRLDPNVPASNILAGARYLKRMLNRFGNLDLALAAYNAGPEAVARSGGAPSGGTLTYVANVRASWHDLRGCR